MNIPAKLAASFTSKSEENKMAAKKCLEIKAYNAGAARAYYSAFQHIKGYLIRNGFDYKRFLQHKGLEDREYSHGTIQSAIINCLMAKGKPLTDIAKLGIIDNLYERRKKADYKPVDIIEPELRASINELNTVLSIVT